MSSATTDLAISRETLTGPPAGALEPIAELPPGFVDAARRYGGVQVSSLSRAQDADRTVGLLLTVNRPHAAYTKIVQTWTADGVADPDAVVGALVEHLVTDAFGAGSVAVKWEFAADDAASRRRAGRAGFEELPTPLSAAPPLSTDPVPLGAVRWRTPRAAGPVPLYWRQTTPFTCGPAALFVAEGLQGGSTVPDREAELQLWREATAGGGTDPIGLALAAARRGLRVQVVLSHADPESRDLDRPADLREVRRFVREGFRTEAAAAGVPVLERGFTIDDVRAEVAGGRVVILLIDVYSQRGKHIPHWVAVYGFHDGAFLVQDSSTEHAFAETWVDLHEHPVPVSTLDRQAWWGNPGYRAMVVIGAP